MNFLKPVVCASILCFLSACSEPTADSQSATETATVAPAAASAPKASLVVESAEQSLTLAAKVMSVATRWNEQPFRVGTSEQCMNWTREVLVEACGPHFATLETQNPWDGHLLGEGDKLLPEHADSLAGDELGDRISTIEALQAGDLVFFKNTYGNWAPGVITHVGIAMGDGTYIHRMTSNKGIVKIEPIPAHEFDSGVRLKEALCE